MNKKQEREARAKAAAEAQAAKTAENVARDLAEGQTPDPVEETTPPAPIPSKTAKRVPTPLSVTLPDGTVKILPVPPSLKKTRKPKTPKGCACGCGGITKGGRFITGHDSLLKSWCLRVERGIVKLADIPDEGIRAAVEAHMQPKGETV